LHSAFYWINPTGNAWLGLCEPVLSQEQPKACPLESMNQSLTKCFFCNSIVFTFIQNDGGTPLPSSVPHSSNRTAKGIFQHTLARNFRKDGPLLLQFSRKRAAASCTRILWGDS
jgi:hypothetical protein